ncbi:MAG: rhodanese-like domain-containing protein [Actinobacteria bacterium]|nr:rhodanese-like domain-containing protein [Actinomycetota bacterium]
MALSTISCDELNHKLGSGELLTIVDALPPMSYAHSHLPGAINLPPERVDASAAKRIADTDAELVVYCANPECESSTDTARRLLALGFTNVRHYPGGKDEWRRLGLPLERAGAPFID